MAIVYKKVAEEDMQQIDFSKMELPFRPLTPWTWAIDRGMRSWLGTLKIGIRHTLTDMSTGEKG